MRVIWRDTFVVPDAPSDFLKASRERLTALPFYVCDTLVEPQRSQPEALRVIERVSRNVAVIGYGDLLRFQFAPFEMANLRPTLAHLRRAPDALTANQVRRAAQEADSNGDWIAVAPMLLLHRAGVGVMQYHATLTAPDPGYSPDEAIEFVRMGIYSQLLRLPDAWRTALPGELVARSQAGALREAAGTHLLVAGMRDISQDAIAGRSGGKEAGRRRRRRRKTPPAVPVSRPTGSTMVILVETDPAPGDDLPAFVAQHAPTLRGIGGLDTFYRERAPWIVERELTDNLSADRELMLYLLGNSELLLYNEELGPIAAHTQKRLGLSNGDHAVTYQYMHYGVLLEWVYIQEAILRTYLQHLDSLVSTATPRRREIIAAMQGALADLVQYQENITPYATRVEFLERARRYHKLDQLAERFESKQELVLNYASEFHDYREARATQFLNWLAGILTGAAVAELIITLAGITPQETTLYLGITLGSVVLVLAILGALLRFT